MLPRPLVFCLSLCVAAVTALVAAEKSAPPAPATFAYVLQADTLGATPAIAAEKFNQSQRDWIVVDANFSEDVAWEASDLKIMRTNNPQRKILAYISIGEAENYRSYWRKVWLKNGKTTAQTPSWLLQENPEWKGNYVVKYWHPEWQKLILDAVQEAMATGFDGVYLDIVDGFETFEKNGKDFEENRINPETKQTYRRDMIDWVKKIATQTRQTKSDALVIPQNGSALLEQDDYFAVISGIGIEDLYTNGDKKQPASDTRDVLDNLQKLFASKKPALLIEYPHKVELQAYTQKRAHEDGFVGLLTDRELQTLGKPFH